jgi:hypothetical protein
MCVSQAHDGEIRAPAAKFLFMNAQLRNVLAAEDSTIVAQKNQHGC